MLVLISESPLTVTWSIPASTKRHQLKQNETEANSTCTGGSGGRGARISQRAIKVPSQMSHFWAKSSLHLLTPTATWALLFLTLVTHWLMLSLFTWRGSPSRPKVLGDRIWDWLISVSPSFWMLWVLKKHQLQEWMGGYPWLVTPHSLETFGSSNPSLPPQLPQLGLEELLSSGHVCSFTAVLLGRGATSQEPWMSRFYTLSIKMLQSTDSVSSWPCPWRTIHDVLTYLLISSP